MRRIFLIGYMGSGKTTLGKAFAKAAGLEFIDLDWYIEERLHKTISKIFAEQGESGFREIERKLLHEAGDFEDGLIACGGGTPCFFDNMDYMNQAGASVDWKNGFPFTAGHGIVCPGNAWKAEVRSMNP